MDAFAKGIIALILSFVIAILAIKSYNFIAKNLHEPLTCLPGASAEAVT